MYSTDYVLAVVLDIDLNELTPFVRKIFVLEDCLNRTLINAQTTVDARVWIDEKLIIGFEVRFILRRMDAIYWASIDAGCVFGLDAWLGNNVWHSRILIC